MTLLALDRVRVRHSEGGRERMVLRDVSLDLDAGELAVVWGLRRSGRSTLLRVAAGLAAPDAGTVRFDGRDLAAHRERLLGDGIGYVQRRLRWAEGQSVLDQATGALLARGLAPSAARMRARAALERAGAERCAGLRLGKLDAGEAVRVALARALALEPRLLVVDEPTKGVDLMERDEILRLLRSLADGGMAVLASTGDSAALSGADRTLALSDGELRGSVTPELAQVVPLRPAAIRQAGG